MTSYLSREVQRFREWAAAGAPDLLGLGHGAEWECNYPYWESLYDAVRELLDSSGPWTPEEIDELLYVLARDNEDEHVAQMLSERKNALRRLLPRIPAADEKDVRWQIASILPQSLGAEARPLLIVLAGDPDEYVRRRARLAIDELDSANDKGPSS